ncbi:phage tail tape measure protein [Nitratireductor mangrovi]|uniref:Phage tail tape measure protein n=1 Tax=Nitratireductor mangrovi TaxID=2599600 RepID=A0A5B8L002_9HYPH|nr:phage tail tape measure protein [Nitratireductor mangrovi]QDZ01122.1 phage tail tape measure protein [Nitratireductor mangrovi]
MPDDSTDYTITFDGTQVTKALEELRDLSDSFGARLAGALKGAAAGGRELEDVLRRVGLSLAEMALGKALAPLQELFSTGYEKFFQVLIDAIPHAKGGIPGKPTRFADGGIVSQPTYFPMQGGFGLMGEAGTEAILPLSRGPDGRLGVAAAGNAAPVSIVFNVQTPDAASFRKSEAQITGMIARAAARGARRN